MPIYGKCAKCGKQTRSKPSYLRKHCSRLCAGLGGLSIAERFWGHVDRSGGSDACWPFDHPGRYGYGVFCTNRRTEHAHRVAWRLTNGPIPAGAHHGTMCILHRCDNPPCCNPAHLFLGTQQENVADMIAKGRKVVATGDDTGARRHPETRPRGDNHPMRLRPELVRRGEMNSRAKLNEGQVRAIREMHAAGANAKALGDMFAVTLENIKAIVKRLTWKHVA